MIRNNIYVFSRHKFKEELKGLSEQQFMATAFISIHEPVKKHGKELFDGASNVILEDAPNILNLWFDDAEDQYPIIGQPNEKLILFNEDMAQQVIEFIESNKDKKQWMLHCTAGINRSSAIGEFLADYFGISHHLFKRDNPQVQGNVLVKNLMRKYL